MAEPPAMTEDGLRQPRTDVHLHDHAVCAYATQEEMLASLSLFLAEGERREELMVFVHAFDDDSAAWRFVSRAAGSEQALREKNIVVVSLYRDAFERGAGRIDHEHVASVVGSLEGQARERGLTGTRIFVDASRNYLGSDRADEWFEFEEWLGRRLQNNVALVCAYQRRDIMQAAVLPRVLRTHAYRFGAGDGQP